MSGERYEMILRHPLLVVVIPEHSSRAFDFFSELGPDFRLAVRLAEGIFCG